MRVTIFLLLASAVNAFTKISTARASVTLLQASPKSKAVPYLEAPKNIPADAPGYAGFDPVGFTDNWLEKDWSQQIVPDIWTEGGAPSRSMPITTIQWMQEAEIKHGRVAMLATVGWIVVDAGIRFPGSSPITGSITSSLVGHDAAVANGSLGMLLLISFVLELAGGAAIYEQAKGSGRQVGDFSFDPLGFGKNPATLKRYKENEIANGRLAMLAFSGIVTQSALGCPFPYF
jgi:hypothetical protein